MAGQPNIIVVICDDLGFGDVGFTGGREAPSVTPRLDELARRSMVYSDFHSNGAVCSPTRAALLTGRYQNHYGIDHVVSAKGHRHTGLPMDAVTVAARLRDAGYATGMVGKWHLGYGDPHHPLRFGFDSFRGYMSGNIDYHSKVDQAGCYDWWDGLGHVEEAGYTTDLITDHACEFVWRHHDRPFFLYVGHEAPHYPYQTRDGEAERTVGEVGPTLGKHHGDAGVYRAMLEALDEGVGRLMDTVHQARLEEQTLFVFTSDHGTPANMGSNGALRGHKGTLWEGGIRVPTLVHWPRRLGVGVDDRLAISLDLTATLHEAAGLARDGIEGESLLQPPVARDVFWTMRDQCATRRGGMKYVRNMPDGVTEGLFDLAADPCEQANLASQRTEDLITMREGFDRWVAQFAAVAKVC